MKYNYYKIYGLVIKTEQFIEQLANTAACENFDILIDFEQMAAGTTYHLSDEAKGLYATRTIDAISLPTLSVFKQYNNPEEFAIVRYINNGQSASAYFVVNQAANHLRVIYTSGIFIQDLITYLTGPVIGCILRLKNKVCLHASVVNINNQAIAFIGEKTAGKSTLIAHLAAKGYPILSDDIAVLFRQEEQFFVHTGYPRLRLWQKSVEQFNTINIEKLNPVLTHVDKYYLPLSFEKKKQWNFQSTPLPLIAVVYLKPRNETQYLAFNLCKSLEGFLHLKKNIYAEYMLTSVLLTKEFSVLGQIAQQLPILSLERPNDLTYMNATCELITKWVANN